VITITKDAAIASVKIALDISHTLRGDLRMTLQTPWGDAVRLHERSGRDGRDDIRGVFDGSVIPALTALHGNSTQGDWRLFVQDLAARDIGRLNRWALGAFRNSFYRLACL